MVMIKTDLIKNNKEQKRVGVPEVKKLEQIGKNTFVIHTQGKDKFEGKFNSRTHAIKNGRIVPR